MSWRDDVKVCAVVVLYRPEPQKLSSLLASAAAQVSTVVLVDNGPTAAAIDAGVTGGDENRIVYLRTAPEAGLAASQNVGIRWALARDFTHLLLLDQDSVPAQDMVARLYESLATLEATGARVAAVGPRYGGGEDGYQGFFVRFSWLGTRRICCQLPREVVEADVLIASGTLARRETLEAVGLMDEGLFLYHVDTDWFMRARALGYRAFGVCAARMEHEIGDGVFRVWLGGWRTYVRYTNPMRLYYIFRNSLLLYRRRHAPLRWILSDAFRLLSFFLTYLALPGRAASGSMMLRGLWDGIRRRTGRY